MKQRFNLKDVVVMSEGGEDEDAQLAVTGLYDAQLLDRLLEPSDIVGFSRGHAISTLIENLPRAGQSRRLIYVPITGGPSGKPESRYHVNTLTHNAAVKLEGGSHLVDFPALLDNPLIRNGIMQPQYFKTISAYWDNLDVALVGIGLPATCDGANWHVLYGGEESGDLDAHQVAGDICSHFFDIHGAMAETNINEKTPSVEMDRLKRARYSIGIAMSEEKHSGIVGALRGKYINCLVTSSNTAELLLK